MLVGSKLIGPIAVVLVVGLILFTTIQYIQNTTTENVTQGITIETLQRDKEVEDAISEAVTQGQRANPNGDLDVSTQWLRDWLDKQ